MKNFLKIFIFTMIIFLTPKVFASEINLSNKVRATYNGTGGTYLGLENYLYGQSNTYSIGTRYNGRLSKIDFYLNSSDWDWNYNTTYTITLNMATEDWRNQFMQIQAFMANDSGVVSTSHNNLYVANTFRFVSYKKIKFDIRTTDVMLTKIKFTLWSGGNSYYFTGVNNWNLSSITIVDQVTPVPTPIPNQPTPTPIPDSSQAIIDNQSQNTQDIIDNQTQNTSDIIENNNQNTQNIIDNQNQNSLDNINQQRQQAYSNCGNIIRFNVAKGYSINGSNTLVPDEDSYYTPDYVAIPSNVRQLTIKGSSTENQTGYFILIYDSNKTLVDYWYSNNRTVNLPIGITYFRLANVNSTIAVFAGNSGCIDEVAGLITDSSIDNKTGFFTNFNNDMHGLSDIITLPLASIQSLTNTSCVALNLPIPFTNDSIDLPCMSQLYDNYAHDIYNLWQIVSFGIISYYICLDIFKMVKGFKDPNEDKIEVLDL